MILLSNERIRRENLAAVQATALTFAVYLRLSCALHRCQKSLDALGTRERPPRDLKHPSALKRARHELKNERVRREPSIGSLKNKFLKPMLSRSPEVRANWCLLSVFIALIGRSWAPLRRAVCGSGGSVYHCSIRYGTEFSTLSQRDAQCFKKGRSQPTTASCCRRHRFQERFGFGEVVTPSPNPRLG